MGWNGVRRPGGVGLLLAVTVGGGLVLAGCGGGQSLGGSVPAAVDSTTTTASATPSAQPTSGGPAPVASTTSGDPTTHPGGGGPAQGGNCTAADLAVTLTPGQDNGMSHHGENVVFTDKGGRTCTLFGFPGVSFVSGPNGNQVGKAADRGQGGGQQITLTPGRSASSPLRIAQTGVYPEEDCRPVQVAGFRVYAPGDTAWTFVNSPQTACSGTTDTQLVVDAVR